MKIIAYFLVLFGSFSIKALYGPLIEQKSLEEKHNAQILECCKGLSLQYLKSEQRSQFYAFCKQNDLSIDNIPLVLMNIKGWEAYVFDIEGKKKYSLPVLPVPIKEENYFGHIMRTADVENFIEKHCVKVEKLSDKENLFYTLTLWHRVWFQCVSNELL